MPFHLFSPPPPHVLPIVLSSALALAAGAYFIARKGVPAGVTECGSKLKQRARLWRNNWRNNSSGRASGSMMFSRAFANRSSAGNSAFDDYRAQTLKQLEEEGDEFRAYLNGLRHAKDKTEFDAFINERRANNIIARAD